MNNSKKISIRDIAYIGMFVAIITICSWINIPLAVPFTLQTFAVFTAIIMLGGLRSTIAVLVYLLLGAVGVPVFANFKGGLAGLLGTTGGYLIGFLLTTIIAGVLMHFFGKKIYIQIIGLFLGLIVCYTFGTAWFIYVYTDTKGTIDLMTALNWCVIPFIIPDCVKLILAVIIGRRVSPFIKM